MINMYKKKCHLNWLCQSEKLRNDNERSKSARKKRGKAQMRIKCKETHRIYTK